MQRIFKILWWQIALVFIFSITTVVSAQSNYFVWEVVDIMVPVGANIDDYKDKYQVMLYIDGVASDDFVVEKAVNSSTFSTVLTYRIGTYKVYYKAVSRRYNVYSTQAISFHVYDDILPKAIGLKDPLLLEYGDEITDYSFIDYSDNYSPKDKITLELDDSLVSYNVLGTYPIQVKVMDEAKNQTAVDLNLKIVDTKAPIIKVIAPLRIAVGSSMQLETYFYGIDNYDGDITKNIKLMGLDLSKTGEQSVLVSLSDSSNNITKLSVIFKVSEQEFSQQTLLQQEIILDIEDYAQYTEEYFKQYIKKVFGNDNESFDFSMDLTNFFCEVNDYPLQYFFTKDNRQFSGILLVKLRELNGPNIIANDTYNFPFGTPIDLLKLVTVVDEYDVTAQNNLELVETNYEENKSGEYYARYRCYNTSGKFTERQVKIVIVKNDRSKNTLNWFVVVNFVVVFLCLSLGGICCYEVIRFIRIKKTRVNH